MSDWLKENYRSFVLPAIIVLVWWWSAGSGRLPLVVIPHPVDALSAIPETWRETDFLSHVLGTVLKAFGGVALGLAAGLLPGILAGYLKSVDSFLHKPVDFLRSIPATTLYPVLLALYPNSLWKETLLVAWVSALLLFVYAQGGAANTPQEKVEAIRALGASKRQIIQKVILPFSLVTVIPGVRVCISLGLILAIVAEMTWTADTGIGGLLYKYREQFAAPKLFAMIIQTGFVGLMANQILHYWWERVKATRGRSIIMPVG